MEKKLGINLVRAINCVKNQLNRCDNDVDKLISNPGRLRRWVEPISKIVDDPKSVLGITLIILSCHYNGAFITSKYKSASVIEGLSRLDGDECTINRKYGLVSVYIPGHSKSVDIIKNMDPKRIEKYINYLGI